MPSKEWGDVGRYSIKQKWKMAICNRYLQIVTAHSGLYSRQQVCHLVWKKTRFTNALPGWTEVEAAVALSSILADWGLVGPHWSLAPDCPLTTLSRLHDWRSTKTSGGVKSVKNFCGENKWHHYLGGEMSEQTNSDSGGDICGKLKATFEWLLTWFSVPRWIG